MGDQVTRSTRQEGRCAVFAVVDHATGEACLDASPRIDRWLVADLRQVCTERFGAGDQAIAGDEITITIDCAQVDWENRSGVPPVSRTRLIRSCWS